MGLFSNVLGDETGGGILPVIECAFRNLTAKPVQGFFFSRVELVVNGAAAVRFEAKYVRIVEGIVMPPGIGAVEFTIP